MHYCTEFQQAGGYVCCESCHEDSNGGYGDLCELENEKHEVVCMACCWFMTHLEGHPELLPEIKRDWRAPK